MIERLARWYLMRKITLDTPDLTDAQKQEAWRHLQDESVLKLLQELRHVHMLQAVRAIPDEANLHRVQSIILFIETLITKARSAK